MMGDQGTSSAVGENAAARSLSSRKGRPSHERALEEKQNIRGPVGQYGSAAGAHRRVRGEVAAAPHSPESGVFPRPLFGPNLGRMDFSPLSIFVFPKSLSRCRPPRSPSVSDGRRPPRFSPPAASTPLLPTVKECSRLMKTKTVRRKTPPD